MVTIKLSNRSLYTFITVAIAIAAVVVVYATVDTSKGWHSVTQIEPPANCGDKVLHWVSDSAGWDCIDYVTQEYVDTEITTVEESIMSYNLYLMAAGCTGGGEGSSEVKGIITPIPTCTTKICDIDHHNGDNCYRDCSGACGNLDIGGLCSISSSRTCHNVPIPRGQSGEFTTYETFVCDTHANGDDCYTDCDGNCDKNIGGCDFTESQTCTL